MKRKIKPKIKTTTDIIEDEGRKIHKTRWNDGNSYCGMRFY